VIIWAYEVPEIHRQAFEKAYGAHGDWTRLFANREGYAGTDLLRDRAEPSRYVTIDRWLSPGDFDRFMARCREAYQLLDQRSEGLASEERLVGSFYYSG
jgi:heme-degrading monooxygenase HmoA